MTYVLLVLFFHSGFTSNEAASSFSNVGPFKKEIDCQVAARKAESLSGKIKTVCIGVQ